jgi:hypothetical protein
MEIIEIVEKAVKFSEATELVNAYKGHLFIIAIVSLMIFLLINSFMKLTCSQNIIGYILNITFKTICLISFAAALVLQFTPSLVDKTGIMVNYPVKEQITDKSKYSLEVTENKDYLKFDNKGNDNIKLIHNNKNVKEKVFKLIEETDKEYLIELEIVDYGFFSDTVRTERVSIHK